MAKARIGHFAEAQVLQSLGVDYIDESEVLTPADYANHIDKWAFTVPFVCGATNLGEALRRITEGAAMIRSKGEAGTGDVSNAVTHMRTIRAELRRLQGMEADELYVAAKELQAPYDLVKEVAANGKLPVVLFTAGGIATPADAAMMMQLGAEGVFVGSGIFKSGNPARAGRGDRQGDDVLRRPRRGRQGLARTRRGDGRHQRRRDPGSRTGSPSAAGDEPRVSPVGGPPWRPPCWRCCPLAACDGEPVEPTRRRRAPAWSWRRPPARSPVEVPAAGVRAWRGIPFAAPPVGDLRWRPPADAEPWVGRPARPRATAQPCLQGTSSSLGSGLIDIEGGSEDCLTLNVSRPDDDREDLPVMVWIHGGSFLHGSGSQPIYNSAGARRPRGRAGDGQLPARAARVLRASRAGGRGRRSRTSGCSTRSRRWSGSATTSRASAETRDNVTVFGESAGGASVNALMASPAARGLFAKAITAVRARP